MQNTRKPNGKLCYSIIPCRFVFVFLASFGYFLVYGYKVVLSVTIVAMVGHNSSNTSESFGHECHREDGSHENSYITGEFDWSEHDQAMILGGFFYGYVITQLPGGYCAERFGAKWIVGLSILATAVLSLLGPIAAKGGYIWFFLTRFGQGLANGVVLPCTNALIARWMPTLERGRATSIIFIGSLLGAVVVLPVAGTLCDTTFLGGWPAPFYLLGAAGCVWFVFWSLLIHENPECHPHISENEYNLIICGQGEEKAAEKPTVPWISIFTSIPVYALIVVHFGQNWGFLTVLTLMPTYFQKILHMDIKSNGLISSLPYILQSLVSLVASFISDKVRQTEKFSVTTIIKFNNTIAFFGPALCMIAVALSKCNATLSIVFFVLAMGFNGCCYPGFNTNHVNMAPDFAGTLFGLTNSIGNIPGFVAPMVAASFYAEGQTIKNWSYVFYLSAAVFVFTQTVYLIFGSAQLQSWGVSNKKDDSITVKDDTIKKVAIQ